MIIRLCFVAMLLLLDSLAQCVSTRGDQTLSAMFASNKSGIVRVRRATTATRHDDESQPAKRGLGKAISYGVNHYPYLGFAVVSGGLTVGNAMLVKSAIHGREQDVLRRKKEEGKPAIDLTKEIAIVKEKYKKQLEAIEKDGKGGGGGGGDKSKGEGKGKGKGKR